MQLFQDFGSRPIYVIRFNPDRYVDSGGRSHPSCFNKNNSVNDEEWNFRSVTLHSKLTEMLEKSHLPLEREVNVDCLFYNGFHCERQITTTAQFIESITSDAEACFWLSFEAKSPFTPAESQTLKCLPRSLLTTVQSYMISSISILVWKRPNSTVHSDGDDYSIQFVLPSNPERCLTFSHFLTTDRSAVWNWHRNGTVEKGVDVVTWVAEFTSPQLPSQVEKWFGPALSGFHVIAKMLCGRDIRSGRNKDL
jgi:hypothetical protein